MPKTGIDGLESGEGEIPCNQTRSSSGFLSEIHIEVLQPPKRARQAASKNFLNVCRVINVTPHAEGGIYLAAEPTETTTAPSGNTMPGRKSPVG